MRNKSFQQSLLEQIFSNTESSYPAFTTSSEQVQSSGPKNKNKQQSCFQIIGEFQQNYAHDRVHNKGKDPKKVGNQCFQTFYGKPQNLSKQNKQNQRPGSKSPIQMPSYSRIVTQRSVIQQNNKDSMVSPLPSSLALLSRTPPHQILQRNQRKKQALLQQLQKQREQKEMAQCSFKPKLYKSKYRATNSGSRNSQITSMDRGQTNKSNKSKSNIWQCDSKQFKETSSFQASEQKQGSLNATEQTNFCKERKSVSVFDSLYMDYKNRQFKMKQAKIKVQKEAKKVPEINDISKMITRHTNFETRRAQYESKRLQKQAELRSNLQKQQKELYKPTINKSSHNRSKQLSIADHLYMVSKRSAHSRSVCNYPDAPTHTPTINKKSMEVYNSRKASVFAHIFHLLSQNSEDGHISMPNICLQQLPKQIVSLLYPLLEQLEMLEISLTFQDFFEAMQRLFYTLSVYERDLLLGFVGGKNNGEKHQNNQQKHPKINKKSQIINHCNQRSSLSIYDFCSIKQAEKEKALQIQRVEQRKRQLKDCTFQPKINTKFRY